MDEKTPAEPCGKILRIKRGYNPNSSSVGSDIPMFMFLLTGTAVFAVVAQQIHAVISRKFGAKPDKSAVTEPPPSEQ